MTVRAVAAMPRALAVALASLPPKGSEDNIKSGTEALTAFKQRLAEMRAKQMHEPPQPGAEG
eukprot:NODE_13909_length_238_cov_1.120219.p3 GENE.NODE_13909_length_238_cov_1.120219~~NODE_13909_length_238_cov_1.120219.p3  ORF type:complete len:62 (-),score=15.00 NODE_13909_length_238_cov_1.120219:8-193(-)